MPHPVQDGEVPLPVLDRGVPKIQSWTGGTPSSPGWRWGGIQSSLGWGYPIQSWMGGTPIMILDWVLPCQQDGVPPSSKTGWGYPIQDWDWVPPSAGGDTPPSGPGMGYPLSAGWGTSWTWDGVPFLSGPETGYPPTPSRKGGQTENITFPHPSDAGGNEWMLLILLMIDKDF